MNTSAYVPGVAAPPMPQAEQPRAGWSTGRVVAAVIGSVLFVLSGALLAGGVALAAVDQTLRDSDGFFMVDGPLLTTGGYALATEPLRLSGDGDAVPEAVLGDARVTATAPPGESIFVGVADASDVEGYLAGVRHSTLASIDGAGGELTATYREAAGGAPATPPGDLDFWVASSVGTGEQTVSWSLGAQDWTVVVMNADGSRDVTVATAAGATVPAIDAATIVLLAVGAVLLVAAVVLLVLALRGPWPSTAGTATATSPEGSPEGGQR